MKFRPTNTFATMIEPSQAVLDYIKKHNPGFVPMPAPSFDIMPRRAAHIDFNIATAFDRHTVFRISYLPFVFFDVIWDYIDTLMDLARIIGNKETRRLSRALRQIRADYDYKRAKTLDWEHRQRIAKHAQQFIEESDPLNWAWKVIHSEYKRKNPDLLPEWVMFIAQADLVCAMFAALTRYARHFDPMITAKAGRKLHTILPNEVRRMQILIPEYLGGMPHTRIRRLVDAVLFKDFLTQPLTDEIE